MKPKQTQPKFLCFDIETMANLVWSWDVFSRGGWRAVDVEKDWHPYSFGAKWLDVNKTMYFSLDQYRGWQPLRVKYKDGSFLHRQPNLRPLLDDMWKLLDEAQGVITWNGKRFDIKKMNSYFLAMGYPPFSPVQHIDVMKEKTKLTSSNYNSLDGTGEEWGTGRKVSHEGFPLWLGCIDGDKKAQKKMKKYCIQDVELTERNYLHLRPWIANHPAMNVLTNNPEACTKCGGTRVHKHSTTARKATSTKTYTYNRCGDCRAMLPSRVPEDSFVKMRYANT